MAAKKTTVSVVRVRCIGCKKERDVKAGEIAPGEQPMCAACFMPCVAVSARAR